MGVFAIPLLAGLAGAIWTDEFRQISSDNLENMKASDGSPSVGIYAVTMPSRLQHIRRFAERNGLDIRYVEGVRAGKFNATHLQETRQIMSRYCQPKRAIALALGHRRALKEFLKSNNSHGVIFEDDVTLAPAQGQERLYGERGIEEVLNVLADTSRASNWSMLNMGRCYDNCETDTVHLTMPGSRTVRLVSSKNPMCAHSYMVTREGAELLLKWTWPFFAVWDAMPILLHRLGNGKVFKIVSTTPRLFDQDRDEVKNGLHEDANPECDLRMAEHYVKWAGDNAWALNMHWQGDEFVYEHHTMTCKY